jgi:hypothetical protein
MTDVNPIITLIFFVSGLSCMILANYLSYTILRNVNAELPEHQKAGHSSVSLDWDLRIARVNRRLYRLGIFQVRGRFLFMMAVASALACAWELGFFDSLHSR